jgi:phage FluMu gp28-like protein
MLIVVKKTEEELLEFLKSEAGFISTLCRWGDKPIQLEPYQLTFLENRSHFRWVVKSRQVGLSWLMALEALARCHLRAGHCAYFISFSQDEAKERILTARQVFEELPAAYRKTLKNDTKTELNFESPGRKKKLSRIISEPAKASRGKRGDVYVDEMAHLLNDMDIYTGTTAVILREDSQFTGCSTPLGQRGIFHEIATEGTRKYPYHSKQEVPWWLCSFLCKDVRAAAVEAPGMSTEERVAEFGKPGLLLQFDSLPLEDFKQEFELSFNSDTESYFPYEQILCCTSDSVQLYDDFNQVPRPEGRLVAGFDVGRSRDVSELALFEFHNDNFICRMLKSYREIAFSDQEAELRRMLKTLPIARLSIDKGGIGMQMTENLARDYPQVAPEIFSTASKERWATDFKILLQQRKVVLPRDRHTVAQIHAIKRKVLSSGNVSFDSDKSKSIGHADRFWAIALACQREREQSRNNGPFIKFTVVGGSKDKTVTFL